MGAIIWLASYPKSGNTWVRAFLANVIADRDTPVPLDEYKRYATSEASGHWYKARLGGEIRGTHRKLVAQLRGLVQTDISAGGNPYVFAKTHNFLGNAYGHPQINLDVTAAAIYIVRNPLDVAVSFARHNGTPIDLAIQTMSQPGTCSSMRTDRVFEWAADWSTHVRSWTQRAHPGLCVVRYEDMLDDPHATFNRIIRFLKMEVSDERLDRAIRFSSFDTLRAMERETGFEEKPERADAFFRAGRKEQWRETLSEEQVQRITARHREQMVRFGYADG